jgi:hypothetical protein
VILNEGLIRDALLKATAEDLDRVLTTIEAYRTCVQTAARLKRKPAMDVQRQQVLDCAAYCEETLAAIAAGEPGSSVYFPETDLAGAQFVLAIHWR